MSTIIGFWQDLRYGLRRLERNPAFTIVAVLTLAVGIGMNTTIFSLFEGLVLHPHGFDTTRLVGITPVFSGGTRDRYLSGPEYDAIRSQAKSFEAVATHDIGNWNLTGISAPERLIRALVTPNVFETYGVAPMIGRGFLPEETRNDPNVRTVIISNRLWRNQLGGEPGLVGDSIELNGTPYEVVGVLPPNFVLGILGLGEADLYTPWVTAYDRLPRSQRELQVVGRLRPGVSIEEAQAEVQVIAEQMEQEHGATTPEYKGWTLRALPLDEVGDPATRTAFAAMLAAVIVVLTIACVNVANLILTRATSRRKEVVIRAALGATRWRLGRQFLAEGLVLSIAGGLLGVQLAYWGLDFLLALFPAQLIPPGAMVSINAQVLIFVTALVTLTAIAFGLAPMWNRDMKAAAAGLQEGSNRILGSLQSLRLTNGLVVIEVALSVVLLAATALVLRSYGNVLNIDAGFDPDDVLIMRVTLPTDKYARPQIPDFFRTAQQRIAALPGITAVGVSNTVPPLGAADASNWISDLNEAEMGPIRAGVTTANPTAGATLASSGHFQALRVPLRRGRLFQASDEVPNAPLAAIVNDRFAAQLFPNVDPLGRRIRARISNAATAWLTIVGVVGTTRNNGMQRPGQAEVFVPAARDDGSWNQMFFTVRTEAPPNEIITAIRMEIRAMDPQLALYRIGSLNEEIRVSLFRWQAAAWLFSVFGLVAGFLAMIGLYGIVSYSVAQRTQELGVRIALGASSLEILRMVVTQGLKLGAAGIAIGTVAALLSTRFISTLLYGVTATDMSSFAWTGLTLLMTVLLASYIPARRAIHVNPAMTLRNE